MKALIKRIIIVIIIALLLSLIIDFCLVILRDAEPLFIIKEEGNTKYSLIYKITYEEDKVTFYLFNFKLEEKQLNNHNWQIIDETGKVCAEEITYFYEDENYRYYFDCAKKYYIQVGTVKYSLKNALENNLVTIEELEDTYIKFNKEEKNAS